MNGSLYMYMYMYVCMFITHVCRTCACACACACAGIFATGWQHNQHVRLTCCLHGQLKISPAFTAFPPLSPERTHAYTPPSHIQTYSVVAVVALAFLFVIAACFLLLSASVLTTFLSYFRACSCSCSSFVFLCYIDSICFTRANSQLQPPVHCTLVPARSTFTHYTYIHT